MEQFFVKELKANFNLRQTKKDKPTMVYCVVFLNGKQYKFTTGVKVYPSMWDSKHQQAVVSRKFSEQENINNSIANQKLEEMYNDFLKFKLYLCNQIEKDTDILSVLRTYLYKDMIVKKDKCDVLIEKAFDYYYNYVSKNPKTSTIDANRTRLKVYLEYIETLPEKDKTVAQLFNQSGLNEYKRYLIDRMNQSVNEKRQFGVKRVNDCGELIARLINDAMVSNNDFQKYKIQPVRWTKLQDIREQEEKGHFPLTDDEVKAIIECENLTDKESEYRTIFLLQIETGVRKSDLNKLLNGDYKRKGDRIILTTQKESIKAYIEITKDLEKYLFSDIPSFKVLNPQKLNDGEYNNYIKKIAEKAELNRIITHKNSVGTELTEPVFKLISSHDARYTFITNKVREGYAPNVLCEMTGHADDRMINEIYARLTDEDKIEKVNRERNRVEGKKNSNNNENDKNGLNELFAFDTILTIDRLLGSNVDAFHLDSTREAIAIIKDLSKISTYSEIDKTKVRQMDKIVFELAYYFKDTQLYSIFQYKEKHFGIIDNVASYEDVEEMFAVEDIERPKQQTQFELEEYEGTLGK